MSELAVGAILVSAIAFIFYPLISVKPTGPFSGTEQADLAGAADPRLSELLDQRDATYKAIKEIEFDHQLGGLSDADYVDLQERYKAKALGILKAIHNLQATSAALTPDEHVVFVKLAVQRQRSHLKGTGDTPTACPRCGAANRSSSRFCLMCGHHLGRICPACGQPQRQGARFCGQCGAALATVPQPAPSRN
ncbi:MAG: zinc ribbon domain-containing protein [Chloroflexota bacterium]